MDLTDEQAAWPMMPPECRRTCPTKGDCTRCGCAKRAGGWTPDMLKERQAALTDEGYHGVAYHRAEIEARRLAQAREAEAPVDPAYRALRALVDRTAEEQDKRADTPTLANKAIDEHVIPPANPKAAQALRDGKAPLDLIEYDAEVEIAKAMLTGAIKYGRRNFAHPTTEILASTYGAALRRHVGLMLKGEDLDGDSGLSHWAHIGANANVVLAAMAAGTYVNDLAPVVTAASAISNARHSGGV